MENSEIISTVPLNDLSIYQFVLQTYNHPNENIIENDTRTEFSLSAFRIMVMGQIERGGGEYSFSSVKKTMQGVSRRGGGFRSISILIQQISIIDIPRTLLHAWKIYLKLICIMHFREKSSQLPYIPLPGPPFSSPQFFSQAFNPQTS